MSSPTLFDLAGWTWFRVSGRDAHKFLHNFCTNDIVKLPQTRGCEAFVTNVKARVLGHIFAFEASDEAGGPAIDVFSFPGQEATLLAHLDRYLIREEVTLEGRSEATAMFLVSGEDQDSASTRPFDLQPFETRATVIGKSRAIARRLDLLGEPGLLLTCDRENSDHVCDVLCSDGAVLGSSEELEARRITAVLPVYGVDVTEDQLAPEVGRPWAINYTKGCYLGQEPIARIDALGHVNRLLRGLRLSEEIAPPQGSLLLAEDKEVGAITSSAPGLAMGYIRSKFADAGTKVDVRLTSGNISATVTAPTLPFESE
jgi:folate-binding protein YgfZ